MEKLKQQFLEETGMNWLNSQGEPDIDYVAWLEKKSMHLKAVYKA
jgi:hypothetical protein